MEISLNKQNQPAERVNHLMVVTQIILMVIIRLNSWFTMTKLERFKAGIDTSGEGREDHSVFF
ncbi:MAG: hypothetical protein FP831_10905 [Anaerolineae bacterium]|nr:hypothetical protein [Anaerolineae bacterium]